MIGGTIFVETSNNIECTILLETMFKIRRDKIKSLILILHFTEPAVPNEIPVLIWAI